MPDNTKNKQRIAKNTFFLTVRSLLLMFISFWTSRVVLDKLGVVDFGVYNVVGGFVGIFGFMKSSFSNVTQRFLNIELGKGDYDRANKIFNQQFLLYVAIAIVVFIAAEAVGYYFIREKLTIPPDRLHSAIIIFHFSVITICLSIIGITYNSAIIAHENMKVFSYIGVVEGCAKLGIAYALSVSNCDRLILYGLLLLFLNFCVQGFTAGFCLKKYRECRFKWYWNKKDVKQTTRFIGWDFINNIVFVVKDQFVTVLLNMFFGPVVNAARAVTAQVNMAVSGFTNNFLTSVKPQLVKSYAKQDYAYTKQLFFKSSKYSLYIMWFFCLPIIASINIILHFWLKKVPPQTDIFIIWNLLEAMCAVLISPSWTITMASGRLKRYVLTCNIPNLLVFPLCYLLFFIGRGAQWAYIIAFLMRLIEIICSLTITNSIVKFGWKNYFKNVVIPFSIVLVISAILTGTSSLLFSNKLLSFLFTSLISVISVVGGIWFLGSTANERNYLIGLVKKYSNRSNVIQ